MRALALFCLLWTSSDAFWGFWHSEDTVSLHPLSPKPNNGNRVKRQAYQLSEGGEVFVALSGGDLAESGVWGPWQKQGQCSRSCGGGVIAETRLCNGQCTGPSVRYFSCNLDNCPETDEDFRAQQCSKNNDNAINAKYYKWVPFPGADKCELTCKPHNESFYYKWADKVIDGTKCDTSSDDICVDGFCLSLGCDGKLGSAAKLDKCGVCNGTGTTCKSQEGVIEESTLSAGYNDVIVLPMGSTTIRVEENRQTSNSLAIKNSSGHYYLNGNHQIQVTDGDIIVGGTVFKYQKSKADGSLTEKLTAKGPLNEEITIQILFQRGSQGSAIKYEFSTPLNEDLQYIYKPGEWSSCSVKCGKGVQTRAAFCTDLTNGQRVGDEDCDSNNATKPVLEKECQTVDCEAEFFVGEWEECSESCGDHGWQYRVIYCHKVFANGKRMTVADSNCTAAERPAVKQSCNRFSCPEWQSGPWSACSEKCGDAKQYRSVTCRSAKAGEEGKLLPAEHCAQKGDRDDAERHCNLGPCDGLAFVTTDWNLCEKCNDTEESRNVSCKDQTGRLYPLEKCLNEKVTEIPVDSRVCATQPPCVYEWHISEWSKCSTECGHGHKSRKVHCAINELGGIKIVDEGLCVSEKPAITENCTNEEKCTGTYYTAGWSKCSAECGGGTQSRLIVCLNYDKEPEPNWCDEAEKPAAEQKCNEQPCPTCGESDFGCCPDNSTFAGGDFFEGCSNCSLSEFGCCADNVTEATGADLFGCPEYLEPTPGSGEEPTEEEPKECDVTNDVGEVVKILCAAANETLEVAELLAGNDTEPENVTKHCSKSEFGCCPDWYTEAEGKEYAGCPKVELGACNGTQHGCCPDNVTLSRGPNMEGCGEASCAASLFGCCKDRKTIAFGPHYFGCERSSFPCELSAFGCCPDGETAALGHNGTGCGSDCLLTKYGCCPDGLTISRGVNNEGCGCTYAQYGCCPDGKTAAKGANYYGCPESCAQSRYGCCPDGKTSSRGENKEGCPCQYTRYGCCPDGETTALGPRKEGCDDCRYAKYGCCPDGESKAFGPEYKGCPTTTMAPVLIGGTVSPKRVAACNLPQDKGSVCGTNYLLAWFFDSQEGRCNQFWYGGCDGNGNRFSSKEECEAVCVEPPGTGRCYLPKVEGPSRCVNLTPRYWYDYQTKQCNAFWWRGCLGNANNFETYQQCLGFCKEVGPEVDAPQYVRPALDIARPPVHRVIANNPPLPVAQAPHHPQLKSREVCNQPKDVGRCEGHFDHYYYDAGLGTCELFQYSGCGGNNNRFSSRDECQNVCLQSAPQPHVPYPSHISNAPVASSGNPCDQPKDQGSCTNFVHKWFYNKADGTCTRFYYGGCDGNSNLFESESACKQRCGNHIDACELPLVVGPCEGKRSRFYFNKNLKQCLAFEYGGCLGNANNFGNKAECEQRCSISSNVAEMSSLDQFVPSAQQICTLPKAVGPCPSNIRMFFYDIESGKCRKFNWGGCEGNANRFEDIAECQRKCWGIRRTEDFEADFVEKTQKRDLESQRPLEIIQITETTTPATTTEENEEVEEEVTVFPQSQNSLPELCVLPEDKGTCYGNHLRYRFDADQRKCVSFVHSGCNPNANNFDSAESCERSCGLYRLQNVCSMAVSKGECSLHVWKWYFDVESRKCKIFNWSGCGGNGNRFTSKSECENLCSAEIEAETEEDFCLLERDSGPCNDPVTQWFYDKSVGECRKFTFGGCRGNANRFNSKTECERRCRSPAANIRTQTEPKEICSQHYDAGICTAMEKKWFFDMASGRCRSFTYGGCGGNLNRFDTELECFNQCKSFANLAAEIRPRARISAVQTSFVLGTPIELRCIYESPTVNVIWFRNSTKLTASNVDSRYYTNGNLLRIIKSQLSDGGEYTCGLGHQGVLSEPLNITVKPLPYSVCSDEWSATTCSFVRRQSLCSLPRHHRYCCRSCSEAEEKKP